MGHRRRPVNDDVSNRDEGLDRRELLGLLGVGGLLLAAPAMATSEDAGRGAPALACDPPTPCPTSKPPLPGKPDVNGMSPLAQLIGVLARNDNDARANRRHFNNCPDKYLRDFFNLSDDEVKALLAFDPGQTFVDLGKELPPINQAPAKWQQLFKLNAVADTFWEEWPSFPKDCLDDPPWCKAEMAPQYAHPETRIVDVDPTTAGNVTTLTVSAEGVVTPFTMQVFDSAGQEVPIANVQRAPDSTFRCSRVTATATLSSGATYSVTLTISGYSPAPFKFQMP